MDNNIITSNEVGFSKSSCQMLGRKIVGLRGWEVKLEFDKEHLYGADEMPVDIVTGTIKPTGTLTMLGYEFDMFNDAAIVAGYQTLGHVPHTLISAVIQLKKDNNSRMRTIAIGALGFTDITMGLKQGDKMREISLPFLAMGIQFL